MLAITLLARPGLAGVAAAWLAVAAWSLVTAPASAGPRAPDAGRPTWFEPSPAGAQVAWLGSIRPLSVSPSARPRRNESP